MKKYLLAIGISTLLTLSIAFAAEEKKEDASKDKALDVKKEATKSIVLISVNGTAIYRSDVLDGINYATKFKKGITEEDFNNTLTSIEDYLVDITIVDIEAKKLNIAVSDEDFEAEYTKMKKSFGENEEDFQKTIAERGLNEEKFKDTFRKNLIRNEFLKETIEPKVMVDEKEAKTFYDQNQNLMTKPENVVVSHILIRTETDDPKKMAQLEDIRKKIMSGENFEKMATNFSDCPSSRNNGSLGPVHKGQTVPKFEEVAFKLEVGEVSEVIQTKFGYHILKVTEKHPEKITSYDESKESIINFLKKPKRKEIFTTYMTSLRESADIKVYEENRPTYTEIVPEERRAKKEEEAPAAEDKKESKEEEAPAAEDKKESKKDDKASSEDKKDEPKK
jgi:peptidyl-prolyl cis-trans isomerase C